MDSVSAFVGGIDFEREIVEDRSLLAEKSKFFHGVVACSCYEGTWGLSFSVHHAAI